jgi:hypothetical protein
LRGGPLARYCSAGVGCGASGAWQGACALNFFKHGSRDAGNNGGAWVFHWGRTVVRLALSLLGVGHDGFQRDVIADNT